MQHDREKQLTHFRKLPHTNNVVDSLAQVELQFPDEMSAEELAEYRSHFEKFRVNLGV